MPTPSTCAQRVMDKMEDLQPSFPDGVTYDVGFDTTPYTRESINEVVKTLRDAIVLVAIVVLLFLQNWRSAIIPLVAVPVAIVGTFAAMAAIGFSLNNLTLFGLVLAIGIVVDDAIVVVEAVEHHIENGMEPRAATIAAMDQVSGPVIAVGLVLSAVFVPCAFISGITGQFFRQFALTIAVSTFISTFNSLTFEPGPDGPVAATARKRRPLPRLPRLAFAAGRRLAGVGVRRPLAAGAALAVPTGARLRGANGSGRLPRLWPWRFSAGAWEGRSIALLAVFFRGFNAGIHQDDTRLRAAGGRIAASQRGGARRLRGAGGSDLV